MNATPHDWSADALLAKAQRYGEAMLGCQHGEWQFGLWSSLLLEHLVRAALAHVSPVLVADGRDWNNVYYALGHRPTASKFRPHSASIQELVKRAGVVVPKFTHEMVSFSAEHVNRRNEELHSGACPYDSLGSAVWQPMFYASCEVLLSFVGFQLGDVFGEDEAKTARVQVDALSDRAAKAAQGLIARAKRRWQKKSNPEREELAGNSAVWASRTIGHRVRCPACKSRAIVHGTPQGPPATKVEEEMIVERQTMLPSVFLCVACGLQIVGFSKLRACGLGDSFTSTSRTDPAEYFSEGTDYGPEPDYNEDEP